MADNVERPAQPDMRLTRMWRRVLVLLLVVVVVAGIGYTAYVGYEGSRQAVSVDENRSRDCGGVTSAAAGTGTAFLPQ